MLCFNVQPIDVNVDYVQNMPIVGTYSYKFLVYCWFEFLYNYCEVLHAINASLQDIASP